MYNGGLLNNYCYCILRARTRDCHVRLVRKKDREKKKKERIVQKKSNHPIKMGGRRKAAVDPESRIALPERDRESLD